MDDFKSSSLSHGLSDTSIDSDHSSEDITFVDSGIGVDSGYQYQSNEVWKHTL